jgi:hypothetical protein
MEQLIKGQWYKRTDVILENYLKYIKPIKLDLQNNEFKYIYSIYETKGYLNNNKIKICTANNFIPIDISEIAHLLPKNHSDLLNKIYELW